MIKRRIGISVTVAAAVTEGNFLSPWRGKQPHARRHEQATGGRHFSAQKKWAVKLGEPHRPLYLPTEGGVFHRKEGYRERDLRPAPRKGPSAGRLMPATPSMAVIQRARASALGERNRDKARRPATLDAHQNAVLAVVTGGGDRLAYVRSTGNTLSANFQNHITLLEATLGRSTLRVDVGHHHAILAGAGNRVGGRERQAELWHVGAMARGALVAVVDVGLGLERVRQLTKREIDHLVLALVQHVEFHGAAGRQTANGARELTGILNGLAVDLRDHVTG